jgi:hypothetical protein
LGWWRDGFAFGRAEPTHLAFGAMNGAPGEAKSNGNGKSKVSAASATPLYLRGKSGEMRGFFASLRMTG